MGHVSITFDFDPCSFKTVMADIGTMLCQQWCSQYGTLYNACQGSVSRTLDLQVGIRRWDNLPSNDQ